MPWSLPSNIVWSCFVSAGRTAAWLRYHVSRASSRLSKFWFYPSGLPLRASMAVKFAKASLCFAPQSTFPGSSASRATGISSSLAFWIQIRLYSTPTSEGRSTDLSAINCLACLLCPRRTWLLVGDSGMPSEPNEWLSSTSFGTVVGGCCWLIWNKQTEFTCPN